jgi:uncharacterized membrane protein YqiK
MQWDVKLQKPFSYSSIGIIILIIVIIIFILIFLINYFKNKPKKVVVKEDNIKDINKIKKEYLSRIDHLIDNINTGTVTKRKAYNELSKIIREFVFKTTNIDVLKYTLVEIKRTNNKELLELINEFYEPEFSKEGKGNLTASIENTRKVITEWK